MKRTVTGEMKYAPKRRKYSKAKASRVPAGVKDYVRQAVHAGRELKTAQPTRVTFPAGISNTLTVTDLMPLIANNSLVSGRVGNKVRVKKAYLRLNITLREQTAANNAGPIYFDIYIVKNRAQGTAPGLIDFLDLGSAGTPYDSSTNPSCGLLDVNTDLVQQKFRKRILLYNVEQNTGLTASGGTMPAHDMYIDCTKYLKDSWIWNDAAGFPTNDNLFLCLGASAAVGGVAGALGQFTSAFHVKYEDA